MEGETQADIDYILTNIVGGGGRWQWVMVFAMWPITFAAGYPLILHMFTAFAPRYYIFFAPNFYLHDFFEAHLTRNDAFCPQTKDFTQEKDTNLHTK